MFSSNVQITLCLSEKLVKTNQWAMPHHYNEINFKVRAKDCAFWVPHSSHRVQHLGHIQSIWTAGDTSNTYHVGACHG